MTTPKTPTRAEAIKELARIAKFAPDTVPADIDYLESQALTAPIEKIEGLKLKHGYNYQSQYAHGWNDALEAVENLYDQGRTQNAPEGEPRMGDLRLAAENALKAYSECCHYNETQWDAFGDEVPAEVTLQRQQADAAISALSAAPPVTGGEKDNCTHVPIKDVLEAISGPTGRLKVTFGDHEATTKISDYCDRLWIAAGLPAEQAQPEDDKTPGA